jgi:hypothetical protein
MIVPQQGSNIRRTTMPRLSEAAMFERTIAQLVSRREEHLTALSEIDGLCAKYGIKLNGVKLASTASPKPVSTAPAKRRRRRHRFGRTADEFVLSLLKAEKSLVTSDINAAWKKSGRGNTADNTLGKLAKEKKVKRTPVKEGRGSMYSLA